MFKLDEYKKQNIFLVVTVGDADNNLDRLFVQI